jgi:hypothetical protein
MNPTTPTHIHSLEMRRPVKKRGRGKGKGKGKGKRRKRVQRGKGGGGGGRLNTLIDKLPIELHWPGHRFTGPGTKLHKRLDKNDQPLPHSKPKNRVDETSMKHDICYRDNKGKQGHTRCDMQMVARLRKIHKPTLRERFDRLVAGTIIRNKVNVER